VDSEFHYYMTYLIAVKAGFRPKDARIIAYASQYVDDNTIAYEVNRGESEYYTNYISQTAAITKPRNELLRVYLVFHFIPGDPMHPCASRRDGKMHILNTTPGSVNAADIMDAAIRSENVYRIGIACHSYADTWSHQNFTGFYDSFNAFKGLFEQALPNIGHVDAQIVPDLPACKWKDRRLTAENCEVDNISRFLDAARCLFEKLRRAADPSCPQQSVERDSHALIRDLRDDMGDDDPENRASQGRIDRYVSRSTSEDYGKEPLDEYNREAWLTDTAQAAIPFVRYLTRWDIQKGAYHWRDILHYKESHWYRFQEAVKEHQSTTLDLLEERVLSRMMSKEEIGDLKRMRIL